MLLERSNSDTLAGFLKYLAQHDPQNTQQGLPTLSALSSELGVSIASLREHLGVARALGFVEVRPRTGMKRMPYSFTPAVRQSLGYALARDESLFKKYSELRNHIEAAYWHEGAQLLTPQDKEELQVLLQRAEEKLAGEPINIPHDEHRDMHMLIYRRLENPFVIGILEAYWDAYEAVGLNVFTGGLKYLEEVWDFHARMVKSICAENFDDGYQALIEHTDLLYHRPGRK